MSALVMRRAVHAEWIRTSSIPTAWTLPLMSAAMSALFTATTIWAIGKPGGPDTSTVEGVRTTLSSGGLTALIACLVGVLTVTTEFRHGTAPVSVLASASRLRWLAAKLAVALGLGLLCTLIGQAVALAVGLPMLADRGIHVDVWQGEYLRSTLGTVSLGVFAAAWGVGIGALVRTQVAAVAGTVIYTALAEGAFLNFVPSVGRYLPGGATAAITLDPAIPRHVAMGYGYLLFAGWAVVFLAAGLRRLTRDDLTVD
jgi:ABC-2 type transport system permease protein